VQQRCVENICAFAETQLAWQRQGVVPSPLRGPKGNQEYVAVFRVTAPD